MIRYIVLEKELRQKELLVKMMSVVESDLGWSWFVSFLIFHAITSVGATAMTTQIYTNSSFVLLLLFWLFSMVAIISFSFFVAALFNKATRGTVVGLLVFFVGYFLTLVADFRDGKSNIIALVSLHPASAFAYGLQEIGRLEDLGVGLTLDTVRTTDSPSGYTFGNTLQNLIADCVLWGILSWFANRVVPSVYGRSLPWYFPFTLSYWCPGRIHFESLELESTASAPDGIIAEEVSSALKEQTKQGKNIELRGLRKVFRDKTITVDGLNLPLYNGQVTALLGHNGAGTYTSRPLGYFDSGMKYHSLLQIAPFAEN
jgi:ATP-binding cassette subfamily A (ABC1) protein 3